MRTRKHAHADPGGQLLNATITDALTDAGRSRITSSDDAMPAVCRAAFQRASGKHVRPDLLGRNAGQFGDQHDPVSRDALPLCHGLTARANAVCERPRASRFQNQIFSGLLVHNCDS